MRILIRPQDRFQAGTPHLPQSRKGRCLPGRWCCIQQNHLLAAQVFGDRDVSIHGETFLPWVIVRRAQRNLQWMPQNWKDRGLGYVEHVTTLRADGIQDAANEARIQHWTSADWAMEFGPQLSLWNHAVARSEGL